MCSIDCILFGTRNLYDEEMRGKDILEVGSYDTNGSLRPFVESRYPRSYVGIDVARGKGVDVLADAENLPFKPESFDVILSTEVFEHLFNWQRVVSGIKKVCKPNGIILVTTRSIGFNFHEYPRDFWRYEPSDMEFIFSDCQIQSLETDKRKGVFIRVLKPNDFTENDLSSYALYSMVTGDRISRIDYEDLKSWHYRKLLTKSRVKGVVRKVFYRIEELGTKL
jgi:SAM-dependent methyltransferase